MKAAIYRKSDGRILRLVTVGAEYLDKQCSEGETFYLDCEAGYTHIIDDKPVVVEVVYKTHIPEPTPEQKTAEMRKRRNSLLRSSDWTQMPDVALSDEQRTAWQVYRQALRDITIDCDPYNIVWPVMP